MWAPVHASLALAYHKSGKPMEAKQVLDKMERREKYRFLDDRAKSMQDLLGLSLVDYFIFDETSHYTHDWIRVERYLTCLALISVIERRFLLIYESELRLTLIFLGLGKYRDKRE